MKTRVCVYGVVLPGDLEPPGPDYWDRMADHAIDQAREDAEDYCIPANWWAEHHQGTPDSWEVTFIVYRETNWVDAARMVC